MNIDQLKVLCPKGETSYINEEKQIKFKDEIIIKKGDLFDKNNKKILFIIVN